MARGGLIDGSAFLAATRDIAPTKGSAPLSAMFVDDGYLQRQPTYAADGSRIRGSEHDVGIWIPDELKSREDEIVGILEDWELRRATQAGIRSIDVGTLRRGQQSFSYPDDSRVAPWLERSVIVSAPPGSQLFTDELLGAWVSTGDIVFRTEASALRTIRSHGMDREFSAVVPVGQAAAERARGASVSARVDAGGAMAALGVATLTALLTMTVHRRRFGASLFARSASGWSFVRSNSDLLVVEAALLGACACTAINSWTGASPSATQWNSVLDPAALSAPVAGLVACGASVVLAATSIAVMATTGRRAIRDHGKET
jgi:hypothetical protein